MPFELASRYTSKHLIIQSSDIALNPPESYFFVQDGLIVSCGILYAMCYIFYMIRTYRDKHISGTIFYLAGTMAYEIYYAIATTSTRFERASFLVWFFLDLCFAGVALTSAYLPSDRGSIIGKLVIGVSIGLCILHALCKVWPDEREQVTAYWTGILLQLPIGWGHLVLMLTERSTRGQSLEIWATRYLGCFTAYGVFIWRYLNVPDNWAYVGSVWSWTIILVTLAPETVYPFVYFWVYSIESASKRKGKVD